MKIQRSHTFYLIRHGETVGNVKRFLLPQEEDIVSPSGIIQAEKLGEALKDVKFTKAVCSDYARTVTTTEIILAHNNVSEKTFVKEARLREIYLGKYENHEYGPIFIDILGFMNKNLEKTEWKAEGSETVDDLKRKTRSFFEDFFKELDASDKDETVLLVSHGCLNMCLLDMLNEHPDISITNWDPSLGKIMRNATYHKFTISSKNEDSKRTMTFSTTHEKSHLKDIQTVDSLTKLAQTPEGKAVAGCFHV